MKTFLSESYTDYSNYTFNYSVYAVSEIKDDIEKIYNKGFLPYTGRNDIKTPTFYLARSLRVNMSLMKETSENRRTIRALEPLDPEMTWVPIEEFDTEDPDFLAFCQRYAEERFKGGSMSAERLKYVLSLGLASHIIICQQKNKENNEPLAYVLVSAHGKGAHYWYAFLNLELMYDYPLGKYVMWKSIVEATEKGYDFMYLGTCYGAHSLYKVRDHKGLEFFDGAKWNSDKKKLKQLCKADGEKDGTDFFKKMDDPQSFIEGL